MNEFLEYSGYLFLLSGAFFTFTAALGVLRFPDFFTRLHPAGVNDSLGLPLILIGLMLHLAAGLVTLKIVLLILFALITSATACHALAKAALHSGMKPLGKIDPEAEEHASSKSR